MFRDAFRIKLLSGAEIEYRRRHRQIWPELLIIMKSAGIYDYSIFMDSDSGTVFGVRKIMEKKNLEQLRQSDLFIKWQVYMSDILEKDEANQKSFTNLDEVFYLE